MAGLRILHAELVLTRANVALVEVRDMNDGSSPDRPTVLPIHAIFAGHSGHREGHDVVNMSSPRKGWKCRGILYSSRVAKPEQVDWG